MSRSRPAARAQWAVQSASGGQTTINGGTIQTTGSGALGLQATGTGSSITTALNDGVGLAITTTGADAHGAQADTGGTLTLVGGTVTTSGSGALGLYATGASSQITATNVTVATSGTDNSANGGLRPDRRRDHAHGL